MKSLCFPTLSVFTGAALLLPSWLVAAAPAPALVWPSTDALPKFDQFPATRMEQRWTRDQLLDGVTTLDYPRGRLREDPLPLVRRFDGLRVSDVLDAMQFLGLQDTGKMDESIRPVWKDTTDAVAHRICGVALTAQYVPTNRPTGAGRLPPAEFKRWHESWYQTLAAEVWVHLTGPGIIVVIDGQGTESTGFLGSHNTLIWKTRGTPGVITNGRCRDVDEVTLQRVPIYASAHGGGTRPGRIELASVNLPVAVGGVLVRPGDLVLADGDGVVVVPREYAETVADIARNEAAIDKERRRRFYDRNKMPHDATVR